jgi:hypothetical protein
MKIFSISLMLLALAGGVLRASAAEQAQVPLDKFRPQWQLGQQWAVETQSQQQQRALPRQQAVTARWQFQVEAVDQLQGKPCWRIVIRIVQGDQLLAEPRTTVWIEQASAAIRQIETQLPTPQGYQRATESYQSGAQAAPVVGLQSLLPIALPQFPEAGVKALDTFQYETVSGAGGVKAVGELGFVTDVRQELIEPTEEGLKAVFDEPEIKALEDAPLLEVKLTTPEQTVRQIWREAAPWPEYADNGVTQMRLIHVAADLRDADSRVPDTRAIDSLARNSLAPRSPAHPASEMPDYVEEIKSLAVSGGVEKASAKITPWSGYWWPMREGRLLVPLGKYDTLTGHRAAEWERQANPPGPDVPRWHGYCHAWAAASIMEPEPRNNHVAASFRDADPASEMPGHVRLNLDIGDQKGLLTACHTENLANSWGDRYGDGQGSEDPLDIYPDLLWRLLKLHLGQQGVALVLDVEPGDEVWNFPVYHYEVQYRPVGAGSGDPRPTDRPQDGAVGRPAPSGMYQADMTLLMADDGVPPAYQGTKTRKQTYQFTFRMRDGNIVMGSGRWTGQSVKDHPDFAWYPYQAVASNPEVKYSKVQRLVTPAQVTPPDAPPATPPAKPTPKPTTKPKPTVKPPATPPKTPPAKPPIELVTTPAQAPGDQAAPEPVIVSPLELVALIASQTSSFGFDATVDRFDGATYKPGERFFVRVKSDRPGYLYLLQVDNSGTPALLYPTAGEDNRLPAGKSVEIRPAGVAEGFPVAGPAGTLRIKAVVTSKPLAFSGSLELLQSAVPAQQQPQNQGQAAPFRWHPAQQQQVKQLLAAQQQPPAEQIGAKQPDELLGPFAQDMTMIYVDTKQEKN